jgi:hypothetical protein
MWDLETSVVSVVDAEGRIVGTGFVVSERLLLTCAHVVQAVGSGPGGRIIIRFHAGGEQREALVSEEGWRPRENEDVAVLQLDADLPAGVLPVTLGGAEGSDGHPFRAFGYPPVGNVEGLWATGKIEGVVRETGRQLLQLTSQNLAQGISGAPVLDETRQQVVGMVTSVVHPDSTTKHRDTGFATPAESLRQAWPGLNVPDASTPGSRSGQRSAALNPFTDLGRIKTPERFFGRERIMRELQQALAAGNSISLVGESQIGKSSLLYHLFLARTIWPVGQRVAYLDLQSVLDEADFCAEVLAAVDQPAGDLAALKRALRADKLVCLLDEVERLAEPDFTPRLQSLLRALVQEGNLLMIVASQRPLQTVFVPSGPTSPLHNVFTEIRLGPFTPTESRAFLQQRLERTRVTFSPAEVEALIQHSGGHPARLQLAARALFDHKCLET